VVRSTGANATAGFVEHGVRRFLVAYEKVTNGSAIPELVCPSDETSVQTCTITTGTALRVGKRSETV
jgi:hypothetical protein